MTQLSDLLSQANSGGKRRSLRQLEADAAKLGYNINFTTIGQYLNGKHGEPTSSILQALADLFSLKVDDLREAAGQRTIGNEPFHLEPEAALLNEEQRAAVRAVVKAMINQIPTDQRVVVDLDDAANWDLAAHPNFETEREKYERLHGDRGEENQDTDN